MLATAIKAGNGNLEGCGRLAAFLDSGAKSGTAPHHHRGTTKLAGETARADSTQEQDCGTTCVRRRVTHVVSTIKWRVIVGSKKILK